MLVVSVGAASAMAHRVPQALGSQSSSGRGIGKRGHRCNQAAQQHAMEVSIIERRDARTTSRSSQVRISASRNKFLQEIRNAFLGSGTNARMRTYGTLDRRILGLYLPVSSQHHYAVRERSLKKLDFCPKIPF